jgi:hypothetical protein
MRDEVLFMAEQVGAEFRGLVVNAKTFQTVAITAHNYCEETIATCAARSMYQQWEKSVKRADAYGDAALACAHAAFDAFISRSDEL